MSTIYGTPGIDTLAGTASDDQIYGYEGADTLYGANGSDTLYGGDGNDTLNGNAHSDSIYGEAGDDLLIDDETAADYFNGGDGTDELQVNAALNLSTSVIENVEILGSRHYNITATAAQFDAFDTIRYSWDQPTARVNLTLAAAGTLDLSDELGTRAVALSGSSGDDTVTTGGGADTISGGAGNDVINGGAGNDQMYGGAGNDTFHVDGLGDTVNEGSGEGTDTVVAAIDYSLASLTNIENLTLSGSGDTDATGNGLANIITGNAGANSLSGAQGDDTLDGGLGDDVISGGGGVDTAVFSSAFSAYAITRDAGTGDYTFTGADGTDIVRADVELIQFGNGPGAVTVDLRAAPTGSGPQAIVSANGPTLTSLAEAGVDEDANSATIAVAENAAAGTLLALVDVADLNFPAGDDIIFSLRTTSGGVYSGPLAIVKTGSGTAELRVSGGIDFEAAATEPVRVVATDVHGNELTQDVTVAVLDVNEAPTAITLTPAAPAADENTRLAANSLIATIAIADDALGGETITLSGADAALFKVVGNEIRLVSALTPDYETRSSYQFTVNVDDGTVGGTPDLSQAVTLAINDIPGLTLVGTAGADTLRGSAEADTLDGGDGNDVLVGYGAGDRLLGGAGLDLANYSMSGVGMTVNLTYSVLQGGVHYGTASDGDLLNGIEYVIGSSTAANHLSGDAYANTLAGGAAADTLIGNAGNDLLNGNGGDDVLDGGNGHDRLAGGDGADHLSGGLGIDQAHYTASTAAVTVDLAAGLVVDGITWGTASDGDLLNGIEIVHGALAATNVLIGDALANTLYGGALDDSLAGGGGADMLVGGDGADTLDGGDANDRLDGGGGADILRGGAGVDRVSYLDVLSEVTVDLGAGLVVGGVTYGSGLDGDLLDSIEFVTGARDFANHLTGAAGNDTLFGGLVDDVLIGNDGADRLVADAGVDTLVGGGGADRIDLGADLAADTIRFNALADASDRVYGFEIGIDTIELSRAGFGLAAGVDFGAGISFQTGSVATGTGPALVWNDTLDRLIYDTNGGASGGATILATLSGVDGLAVDDLLLIA